MLLYGVITALTVHVFFGWRENTLRMLIGIAHNTAETAGHDQAG